MLVSLLKPACMLQTARQRSAPAALSIQSHESLLTRRATHSSPQKSGFWGPQSQKPRTHCHPSKELLRVPRAAAGPKGLCRGIKHVASEPQLFALDGSGDHAGIACSTAQSFKLMGHIVPAIQPLGTELLLVSSTASLLGQQPESATAVPHSGLAPQHARLPQRPLSMSASRGDLPLDSGIAAKIVEAVHRDGATVLDGLVMPSIGSQKQVSTTSSSIIAKNGSDFGNPQADLAALDQVAEKLCELHAASFMQSDAPDTKTDRSSFEFNPTKADPYASSPAQVSGFLESGNLTTAFAQNKARIDSADQAQGKSAQPQPKSVYQNGSEAAHASGNAGETELI